MLCSVLIELRHKGNYIFLFLKYIMYFCNLPKTNRNFMKKKILSMAVALLCAVSAHAQFEEGKVFVGGSLTGLNMKYTGSDKFSYGVQAQAGYMVADDLMLLGQTSFEHSGNDAIDDKFTVGVGGRYYIEQNGIYLGVNCKFVHAGKNFNDVMPGVEVGYAFFLNNSVTVEPAIYYDQSFKNHSDYSTIGLRLGVGVYLFKQ